ncbi:MAG: hypothetical protein A4E48_00888 [Methanosaeta sp. PtaU1.Bin060]|nr:MAG: hypothetical protein A4E48_00888 [Methanosaeta sp. PtaU1.Bin060]
MMVILFSTMRAQLSLLLLILFLAALSQGGSFLGPANKDALVFDEMNAIKIAQANLTATGLNSSYPFGGIAIYSENQNISGTFRGPREISGAEISVSLTALRSPESLMTLMDRSTKSVAGSLIQLNHTGSAHFSLPGVASGAYLISVSDVLNHTTLCISPLLVTKEELSIPSPSALRSEGMTRIRLNVSGGNETKIYGAIMMPKKDYETASISICANGTSKDLLATIALGNKSLQIQNILINSSQLMMSLLTILPADSALAYQESKENETELLLLTDEPLKKGEYMLTCAVYSARRGILGLMQRELVVM